MKQREGFGDFELYGRCDLMITASFQKQEILKGGEYIMCGCGCDCCKSCHSHGEMEEMDYSKWPKEKLHEKKEMLEKKMKMVSEALEKAK